MGEKLEKSKSHPMVNLIRIGERRVLLCIVLTTHNYEGGIGITTRTENKGLYGNRIIDFLGEAQNAFTTPDLTQYNGSTRLTAVTLLKINSI